MVYILSWIDVYGKMFRTSTIYNKRTNFGFLGFPKKTVPLIHWQLLPYSYSFWTCPIREAVSTTGLGIAPQLVGQSLPAVKSPWLLGQGPGAVGQQGQRWDRHSMAGFAPSIPGVVLLGMTPQRPCGTLTSSFMTTMDEYLPSRDHFSISFVGAGILGILLQ